MGKRRGFTLVELLVVIAIIALLMSILMPTLAKVKNQARAAACMSNLNQMGLAAHMYCNDNDSLFQLGNYSDATHASTHFDHWASAWEPYYQGQDLRCCPTTPKSKSRYDENSVDRGLRAPFIGWGIESGDYSDDDSKRWVRGGHYGSYGINGYVMSKPTEPDNWRRNDVKGAGYVPLLGDATWIDGWPWHTSGPPEYEDEHYLLTTSSFTRFCIDRHYGGVNWVFIDNAVKRVGLKQLWRLKWHRYYDVSYPEADWSIGNGWMLKFKSYDDPP